MNRGSVIVGLMGSLLLTSCHSHSSAEDQCLANEWRADQCIKNGDYTKAETFYQDALRNAQSSESLLQLPQVLQEQGELFLKERKIVEAEESFRKSLESYGAIKSDGSPDSTIRANVTKIQEGKIRLLEKLANALELENKNDEAEKCYKEALKLNRSMGGSVDDNVRIAESCSKLLRKLHKNSEAETMEAAADSVGLTSREVDARFWAQMKIFERGEQIDKCAQNFKSLAIGAKRFGNSNLYWLAKTEQGLAELVLSRFPQAEDSLQDALQTAKTLPRDEAYKRSLAKAIALLASCLYFEGKEPEATGLFLQGEQIDSEGSNNAFYELIAVFGHSGNIKRARSLCDQIVKLAGVDKGKNPGWYQALLISSVRIGDLYNAAGDTANYDTVIQRAVQIYPKIRKPGIKWQDLLAREATVNYQKHQFSAAEALLDQAIVLNEKDFGKNGAETAKVISMQATVYQSEHKDEKALASYKRACAVMAQQKTWSAEFLLTLQLMAQLQLSLGKVADALDVGKQAVSVSEKIAPDKLPVELSLLAQCYMKQKNYSAADELYMRALDLLQKAGGGESEPAASILNQVGDVFNEQKSYPMAEQYFRRSLMIYRDKLSGKFPEMVAGIKSKLAQLQKK